MIGGYSMNLVVHALRAALFLHGLWQHVAHPIRCCGRQHCQQHILGCRGGATASPAVMHQPCLPSFAGRRGGWMS